MADNFNVKQFLAENKLGPYSRLKETEEGYMGTQYDSSEDMAVDMVKKGITEYEVIYIVRDGRCYRKDDEGNMDEVNMSYCKRFAEGEEKVEEAGQGDLMTVDRIEEIVNNLARNISTNSNIPTQEKLGLVQALKELKDLVEDLGASVEMGMNETKKPIKEGGDIFDDIEADLEYGDDGPEGAIEYLREVIDFCEKKIIEFENEIGYEDEDDDDNYLIDPTYKNEAFGGKNPEGDKLVLRFLQGVSKKFNYPVAQAARFVKDTIKSLGY